MILTHLTLYSFFNGAGTSAANVEVLLTGFDIVLSLGSLSFLIASVPSGTTTSTRTTTKRGTGQSFLGKMRPRRNR